MPLPYLDYIRDDHSELQYWQDPTLLWLSPRLQWTKVAVFHWYKRESPDQQLMDLISYNWHLTDLYRGLFLLQWDGHPKNRTHIFCNIITCGKARNKEFTTNHREPGEEKGTIKARGGGSQPKSKGTKDMKEREDLQHGRHEHGINWVFRAAKAIRRSSGAPRGEEREPRQGVLMRSAITLNMPALSCESRQDES